MKAEPPEVSESVVDIKRVPKVIESVEMTKAYLIEEFTAALQARDRASNDRYGSVIRDAKEYIRANFSQSDLSLNRMPCTLASVRAISARFSSRRRGSPLWSI